MGKQSSHAGQVRAGPEPERVGPLSKVSLTASLVAGLLDASPDGLLLSDSEGRLVLVNSQIEALFGYRRGELLGKPVEILVPEAKRKRHHGHRQQFALEPRHRPMGIGLTLAGRRKGGREFPVEVSLRPLTTGQDTWTVATVRDATERQKVERQRRENALTAEQARIAEELTDTVIRGLFGAGLRLQSLVEFTAEPVRSALLDVVDDIDLTIKQIRQQVFDLQPAERPAGFVHLDAALISES